MQALRLDKNRGSNVQYAPPFEKNRFISDSLYMLQVDDLEDELLNETVLDNTG
jgi:hypothetical protein